MRVKVSVESSVEKNSEFILSRYRNISGRTKIYPAYSLDRPEAGRSPEYPEAVDAIALEIGGNRQIRSGPEIYPGYTPDRP